MKPKKIKGFTCPECGSKEVLVIEMEQVYNEMRYKLKCICEHEWRDYSSETN